MRKKLVKYVGRMNSSLNFMGNTSKHQNNDDGGNTRHLYLSLILKIFISYRDFLEKKYAVDISSVGSKRKDDGYKRRVKLSDCVFTNSHIQS
jgi:hypothetical protein